MYFYQVDSLIIAMVAMGLFLAARQASQFPDRNARLATALEAISWPLAMVISLALGSALEPGIRPDFMAPAFSLVYTALAFDVLRRTGSSPLAKMIGMSISLVIAVSFTLGVAMEPSAISALFSVVAGVSLLLFGAAYSKPFTTIAGLVTLGAGIVFGHDAILQLIVNSSWIDLAIFGAGAIALGSVLDRHGIAIKLRLTHWMEVAGHRSD
jgi:hypothetical protein